MAKAVGIWGRIPDMFVNKGLSCLMRIGLGAALKTSQREASHLGGAPFGDKLLVGSSAVGDTQLGKPFEATSHE